MRKLSRKDLKNYKVFDTGYCGVWHITHSDLVEEIGKNTGELGWNWTAYRVKGTNVIILDSYRNTLREWFNNFSKIRKELEELNDRTYQLYKKTEEEKAQILEDLQNLLNG